MPDASESNADVSPVGNLRHTETSKEIAILQATLDLIADKGLHAAPISQIARRSAVSAGIIYHYFEDKEDLIAALYRKVKTEYAEALIAHAPHLQPFPDCLHQLWLNAYHYHINHPKATLFLEQYENSPYYSTLPESDYTESYKLLFGMVARLIEEGWVRDLPFPVLQELTLGVAVGIAKRTLAGALVLDAAELEAVAAACCRAVQP